MILGAQFEISFTYNKNNKGPSTDFPQTLLHNLDCLSAIVNWLRHIVHPCWSCQMEDANTRFLVMTVTQKRSAIDTVHIY